MGGVPKSRKHKFPWTDFQSPCGFYMTQLANPRRSVQQNVFCRSDLLLPARFDRPDRFIGVTFWPRGVQLGVRTCKSSHSAREGRRNRKTTLSQAIYRKTEPRSPKVMPKLSPEWIGVCFRSPRCSQRHPVAYICPSKTHSRTSILVLGRHVLEDFGSSSYQARSGSLLEAQIQHFGQTNHAM